jgi:anti-sigma regulatory factor (Ser/Thr protein kinase)
MHLGHQLGFVSASDQRSHHRMPELPGSVLPAPSRLDRIILAPAPRSARGAREFTAVTLRRWRLDELIFDATVIASELVTNAICHGDGPVREHVRLTWSHQASRLVCVVTDRTTNPPVMAPQDPEAESGHGLHIVSGLATSWGWTRLRTGEKAVWAALAVPDAGAAEGRPEQSADSRGHRVAASIA